MRHGSGGSEMTVVEAVMVNILHTLQTLGLWERP